VAERAIHVYDDVLKFFAGGDHQLKTALEDKMTLPRLHFFVSIAKHLEKFLKEYQTDRPMIAYLAKDLKDVFRVSCLPFSCVPLLTHFLF
jgi:hypothetical protein